MPRSEKMVRDLMTVKLEQAKAKEKEMRQEYRLEKTKLQREYKEVGREDKFRKVIKRIARQSQERWRKGQREAMSKMKFQKNKIQRRIENEKRKEDTKKEKSQTEESIED